MKNLSSFDRKLTIGLLSLLLIFILLLSTSFVTEANKVLTVSLNKSNFQPRELIVFPGQKVIWKNNATTPNSVVSDDNLWNSGKINAGDSYSVLFDRPGIFLYHSNNMQGLIKVTG